MKFGKPGYLFGYQSFKNKKTLPSNGKFPFFVIVYEICSDLSKTKDDEDLQSRQKYFLTGKSAKTSQSRINSSLELSICCNVDKCG